MAPALVIPALEADVSETTNLYKQYPEVVREMEALLKTYQPAAGNSPKDNARQEEQKQGIR